MIAIGDRFKRKGFAGPVYTARTEYQWNGERRIVGWYQHAPAQRVGIDMPEDQLVKVAAEAAFWRQSP